MDHKTIRKHAAELARDIRSMWPELRGGWTRREWNAQARNTARQFIRNTVHFQRMNRG